MSKQIMFEGKIKISPTLDEETYKLLSGLHQTRRMARDAEALRKATFKNYGSQGEFYTGDDNIAVTDVNTPPSTQPTLNLSWMPTDDRAHLVWDRGEYGGAMTEWLQYLVDKVLAPRGFIVEGVVNGRDFASDVPEPPFHIRCSKGSVSVHSMYSDAAPQPDYDKWLGEMYGDVKHPALLSEHAYDGYRMLNYGDFIIIYDKICTISMACRMTSEEAEAYLKNHADGMEREMGALKWNELKKTHSKSKRK